MCKAPQMSYHHNNTADSYIGGWMALSNVRRVTLVTPGPWVLAAKKCWRVLQPCAGVTLIYFQYMLYVNAIPAFDMRPAADSTACKLMITCDLGACPGTSRPCMGWARRSHHLVLGAQTQDLDNSLGNAAKRCPALRCRSCPPTDSIWAGSPHG